MQVAYTCTTFFCGGSVEVVKAIREATHQGVPNKSIDLTERPLSRTYSSAMRQRRIATTHKGEQIVMHPKEPKAIVKES